MSKHKRIDPENRAEIRHLRWEIWSWSKYIIFYLIGLAAYVLPVVYYFSGVINIVELIRYIFFAFAYSTLIVGCKMGKMDEDIGSLFLIFLVALAGPIVLVIGLVSIFSEIKECADDIKFCKEMINDEKDYNEGNEDTLYEKIDKKRRACKIWGWVVFVLSVVYLAIASSYFAMKVDPNTGTEMQSTQLSAPLAWVYLGFWVVAIILWCVAKYFRNELFYICPMCYNGRGVEVNRDLIKEEGYEIEKTQYNEVANPFSYADYDNVKYYEKNVTKKEYVTDETYHITYKCPHCNRVWQRSKSEMTYKER